MENYEENDHEREKTKNLLIELRNKIQDKRPDPHKVLSFLQLIHNHKTTINLKKEGIRLIVVLDWLNAWNWMIKAVHS